MLFLKGISIARHSYWFIDLLCILWMTPEDHNNERECYFILYKYLGKQPTLHSIIMRNPISSNINVTLQSFSSSMRKEGLLELTEYLAFQGYYISYNYSFWISTCSVTSTGNLFALLVWQQFKQTSCWLQYWIVQMKLLLDV